MSRSFTAEELRAYSNKKGSQKLLFSVEGTVYDVSANREAYGPEASYGVFPGHDITYCLARTSLELEDLDKPWRGRLAEDDQGRVNAFKQMFAKKYPVVGVLAPTASL